jgi:hypothetical protein
LFSSHSCCCLIPRRAPGTIPAAAAAASDRALATRYEVEPIRLDDGTIEVAIANPLDLTCGGG